ncbi:MAG: PKD domain-containing protein, partial [Thermoplasmata archaeon]|nr:PKD domain-containing protein [Thermoplasmata archaeon]
VTVYATVENAVYASEVPWVGTPCWVWQGMLGDYIPSTLAHPDSDFDPYVGLDYQCRDPGSYLYGGMMPFDHTPGSFDLGAGDTMTFEWPAGDQMFLQHQAYGYTLETFGEMEAVYSEPAVTDMPGQVAVDESSRTVTFTGPIDFEEWSVTQTAHDYLESEWDRLGILPYGMPYMQFSQASDSGDVIYDCVLLEQFDSWETLDANWTITNNTNGLFENWFDVVDGNLVASDNGLLVYSDYTSYANWTGLVRYDDRLWVSFDIYLPMDYNVKDGWAGQVFYVGLLDENGDFGLLTRFVMDTSTYPNGFVYWSADGTIKQICPFTAGWHSVDIWMDKGETTWTAIFDSIAYPGLTYSQPGTSPFDLSEVTFMNALREEPDTILVNSLGITRVTSTAGELSDPPSVWADVYPYAGSSYDPFYLYAYCYDDETPVDQLMVRWDWEGDGLWDTGWTAEKFAYHFYPYSGVFHPTVQVMDEDGQTGEWSDYVIVDNAPPVAVAGGDVTVPQYSMVTLDATASYDDVGIAAYLWEVYGTWYTWSDQPVMEAWFDTPGTYTAVLTVWDLAWHSGTDYVTITVEPVHVVTVTSDQKSENVITYIYTPESDGAWIAKVHNEGLKWLLVEVYELGPNEKLVGKDMLSFKNMGAYPDGTVLSDMFMLKGSTSYLVKLTPSGEIGTFATVMDVFISLGSYAAAEEEVVSARTWSDG